MNHGSTSRAGRVHVAESSAWRTRGQLESGLEEESCATRSFQFEACELEDVMLVFAQSQAWVHLLAHLLCMTQTSTREGGRGLQSHVFDRQLGSRFRGHFRLFVMAIADDEASVTSPFRFCSRP